MAVPYSQSSPGDILCSDLTLIAWRNFAGSGKTAIGVVFRRTANSISAISLSVNPYSFWAGYDFDIPDLTNYADEYSAATDLDGIYGTDRLMFWLGSGAAAIARSFSTPGTNAGQWYLPAFGELALVGQHKTEIASALQACSGAGLVGTPSWTSTECDETTAWVVDASSNSYYIVPKTQSLPVRRAIKLIY